MKEEIYNRIKNNFIDIEVNKKVSEYTNNRYDLSKISNNLWWSWNTEFLKLFKEIDIYYKAKKIEKNTTDPVYIQTHVGIGYRMNQL